MIPVELYPLILLNADIDVIQEFLRTCKHINISFDFWIQKFEKDNLPIITIQLKQTNHMWIKEYKNVLDAKRQASYVLNNKFNQVVLENNYYFNGGSLHDLFPIILFMYSRHDSDIISILLPDRYQIPLDELKNYTQEEIDNQKMRDIEIINTSHNHQHTIVPENFNLNYLMIRLFYYAPFEIRICNNNVLLRA